MDEQQSNKVEPSIGDFGLEAQGVCSRTAAYRPALATPDGLPDALEQVARSLDAPGQWVLGEAKGPQ